MATWEPVIEELKLGLGVEKEGPGISSCIDALSTLQVNVSGRLLDVMMGTYAQWRRAESDKKARLGLGLGIGVKGARKVPSGRQGLGSLHTHAQRKGHRGSGHMDPPPTSFPTAKVMATTTTGTDHSIMPYATAATRTRASSKASTNTSLTNHHHKYPHQRNHAGANTVIALYATSSSTARGVMGIRGGASQGVGVSGLGDTTGGGGSLREKEHSAREKEKARRPGATVYAPPMILR